MKARQLCYENYPWYTITFANFVSLATYATGILLISGLGIIPICFYIGLILFHEVRLLKTGCTKCYYYDRYCAFGKGKLSALLFKKEDPSLFQARGFSWYALLPDILITVIPLLVGIYLIIADFRWILIPLILLLIILASYGNALVRGSMACKHCKQKMLGCAADQFFNKNHK